jgi:hypothetical protein
MGNTILEKVVEKLFGEVAGFAWLFFILLLLCDALGHKGFFGAIIAFILGLLFFISSKLLDDHLFDPLFKPGPDFRLGPHDNRDSTNYSLVVERTFATYGDFVTLADKDKMENKRPWPLILLAPFRLILRAPIGLILLALKLIRLILIAIIRLIIRLILLVRERDAGNLQLWLTRKGLDDAFDGWMWRRKVADLFGLKICSGSYPKFPLYKSCELILRPTKKWSQVNSWLQISKVARAFILPLLLIAVVDALVDLFNFDRIQTLLSGVGAETIIRTISVWMTPIIEQYVHSPIMTIIRTISDWASIIEHKIHELTIAALSKWWVAFVLFVLALWVYLGVRIHSMRALYEETSKAKWVDAPDLCHSPSRVDPGHQHVRQSGAQHGTSPDRRVGSY